LNEWLIPRLPMDYFNLETWRSCTLWETLGIACRKREIVAHKEILQWYAIGYCPSESLVVRPKPNETAVMFLINGVMGWSHLRNDEFAEVFRA
jgi:hypothetical protein